MTASLLDLGGTTRSRTAHDTLTTIAPLIETAGITRLADLTHLDDIGVPVYTAIRPASKNLSTSQGKGITPDLAKCSAYMEAIELFYAETIRVDRTATVSGMSSETYCYIPTLTPGYIHQDDPSLDWTELQSPWQHETAYFPSHLINFDLSEPHIEDGLFLKRTTGLASGNCFEEALCHSLYEIIERDSMAHFEQNAPDTTRIIDPSSIDFQPACEILEQCQSAQANAYVFDITQPNLPAASCYVMLADQHPLRKLPHFMGAGTHLNRGIALCRALTEAIQSRLTYIAGSRDDMMPHQYNRQWEPMTFTGTRHFHEMPDHPYTDFTTQLQQLETFFRAEKQPIFYHRFTPDDCPISVLKAIAPGLQP